MIHAATSAFLAFTIYTSKYVKDSRYSYGAGFGLEITGFLLALAGTAGLAYHLVMKTGFGDDGYIGF